MNYYLFLCGDTLVWCASEKNFNDMYNDDKYKYMGSILERGISTGPNIEPFNGKNLWLI